MLGREVLGKKVLGKKVLERRVFRRNTTVHGQSGNVRKA